MSVVGQTSHGKNFRFPFSDGENAELAALLVRDIAENDQPVGIGPSVMRGMVNQRQLPQTGAVPVGGEHPRHIKSLSGTAWTEEAETVNERDPFAVRREQQMIEPVHGFETAAGGKFLHDPGQRDNQFAFAGLKVHQENSVVFRMGEIRGRIGHVGIAVTRPFDMQTGEIHGQGITAVGGHGVDRPRQDFPVGKAGNEMVVFHIVPDQGIVIEILEHGTELPAPGIGFGEFVEFPVVQDPELGFFPEMRLPSGKLHLVDRMFAAAVPRAFIEIAEKIMGVIRGDPFFQILIEFIHAFRSLSFWLQTDIS